MIPIESGSLSSMTARRDGNWGLVNFFYQPEEVVFRSLTEVLKGVGKKYYPVRGKKIDNLIYQIKNDNSFKITLGNCVIKKVNNSVIVSKER